jgi:hypothetical protein
LFEKQVIKLYLQQADPKTYLFFVVFLENNEEGLFSLGWVCGTAIPLTDRVTRKNKTKKVVYKLFDR